MSPITNTSMQTGAHFPVACIYHQNCWDGIGAAWIVKDYFEKKNTEVACFEGVYQQEPDYEQLACYDRIIIVDFSYPPEVLDLLAKNSTITILDHHESAIKMLKDYSNPDVEIVFNVANSQSGIGVTWTYFYPSKFLPIQLAWIEDRDIWTWQLLGTKDFTAALQQYPITKEAMQEIMDRPEGALLEEGALINKLLAAQIDKVLATSYTQSFEGFEDIPFINCPAFLMSEALNILAIGVPFAVGWYYDGPTRQIKYSLRSDKDTKIAEDVSLLAKQYGGGGHKNAAGFILDSDAPTITIYDSMG